MKKKTYRTLDFLQYEQFSDQSFRLVLVNHEGQHLLNAYGNVSVSLSQPYCMKEPHDNS